MSNILLNLNNWWLISVVFNFFIVFFKVLPISFGCNIYCTVELLKIVTKTLRSRNVIKIPVQCIPAFSPEMWLKYRRLDVWYIPKIVHNKDTLFFIRFCVWKFCICNLLIVRNFCQTWLRKIVKNGTHVFCCLMYGKLICEHLWYYLLFQKFFLFNLLLGTLQMQGAPNKKWCT